MNIPGRLLLFCAAALCGCGPYKEAKYVEVLPNETAFVIPLEGDITKQGKMQSIEALEKAKVMTKRIYLTQRKRKLGRGYINYEWVPTLKVIKVDRRPVTREWTAEAETGTSPAHQALEVESRDSINFSVGSTITSRVEESDTARFLYFYSGRSLAEIVDSNVRGFCQQQMADKFGELDLSEGKKQKSRIFQEVFDETSAFFAEKGITVDFFGGIKGLQYRNQEIQDAIDAKFVQEIDAQTAQQELRQQEIRNQIIVSIAEAERDAAQALAQAQNALRFKTMLDIAMIEAEATKKAAGKWNGRLPSGIMPAGSELLFGLEQQPAGLSDGQILPEVSPDSVLSTTATQTP